MVKLFSRFSRRPQFSIPPSWRLAWGEVPPLDDATWQEEGLAIFGATVAVSPSQRFVVAGEALGCCTLSEIAEAWERWGADAWTQVRGMFAVAVWDRQERRLVLGRDRSGHRTLYYTTQGRTRWIAPTLRTLNPYHPRHLDLIALRDYLCCAFVPGDRTLWQHVRELRPGCTLTLPENTLKAYWHLAENLPTTAAAIEQYAESLRHLLEEIVRESLPENEAVGVLLSGGLDSSCITALAAQLHSQPVHTFSIHFGSECPNELEFSSLVADHCSTEHHILEIPFSTMWEKLPETMAWLDDPIGDPLTVPNLLMGCYAKGFVNRILNGEGGDPCFGGPKNQPMLLHQLYNPIADRDLLQAYLLSFQKCANELSQLLNPEVWQAVREEASVFSEDLNSGASYLNRLMMLNIKFKGADQILTKVNNLMRGAGLEARSPLFDERIVELSMSIPPEYKLSGVEEKAVLKRAVEDLLPAAIIQRPKSGMMVPVQLGFMKYWQKEGRGLLLNRNAKTAPYFNREILRGWLNYRGDTWRRYGVKLWLLVSLEIWLEENG